MRTHQSQQASVPCSEPRQTEPGAYEMIKNEGRPTALKALDHLQSTRQSLMQLVPVETTLGS